MPRGGDHHLPGTLVPPGALRLASRRSRSALCPRETAIIRSGRWRKRRGRSSPGGAPSSDGRRRPGRRCGRRGAPAPSRASTRPRPRRRHEERARLARHADAGGLSRSSNAGGLLGPPRPGRERRRRLHRALRGGGGFRRAPRRGARGELRRDEDQASPGSRGREPRRTRDEAGGARRTRPNTGVPAEARPPAFTATVISGEMSPAGGAGRRRELGRLRETRGRAVRRRSRCWPAAPA